MRVGIVGAGISGLGAARELARNGHEVVVFEKSKGVGGRCATRRVNGYVFDTGATSIAPRSQALNDAILNQLDRTDLVIIDKPIYTHDGSRILRGSMGKGLAERYCYAPGISKLGKLLAEGLDVRLEAEVTAIERPGDGGFCLAGEVFDVVVLTAPAPQAEALLRNARDTRKLANAKYRPCLSVLLGYETPLETPYHALIEPDQRLPLTWLSVETMKVPGHRAPGLGTALVAQMSPSYSRLRFEATADRIIDETLIDVVRLLGQPFQTPDVSDVKRWRYSQPETTASFESANPPGTRLVVAGDGLLGGRIELAYETGLRAARHIQGLNS
ncbi:MAG: FAD-dependent oxidoreductase [Fimbriimonadaceae bacterium]|nr:FAD-dependent oxidoreductase [Fimbriimonadaceae bacterium]QYK56613.1 MAG: FAD-dependent oxidoreductase [Fimbriimonadaceae bacterium]